jgi:AcrR family transcriptional regulator
MSLQAICTDPTLPDVSDWENRFEMLATRTRTKPAEERRDDLMNAAETLFLEQGFDRTTIEEITTAAGVAKGTFYLQFPAKTDVLEALRQRFVRQLMDRIVDEVDRQAPEDWPAKLSAWARACAGGYLEAARLHHLVFVAVPPSSQEGLTRNVVIDHLAELLAAGCNSRAWSLDDAGFTASFLFAALHGVVNRRGEDRSHGEQLLPRLEDHFFRVVGLTAEWTAS